MIIHQIIERTRSNGPGIRFTLWLQGCSRKCRGCSNPETHDFTKGFSLSPEEVFSKIQQNIDEIDGISISGGEPLDQFEDLIELLELINHKTSLPVILWTGYDESEIQKMFIFNKLKSLIDIMIVGPYIERYHRPEGLKGSSNQKYLFFSNRYTDDDILNVPAAEIIFSDGEIKLTGINIGLIKGWFK